LLCYLCALLLCCSARRCAGVPRSPVRYCYAVAVFRGVQRCLWSVRRLYCCGASLSSDTHA
jgi:hypothetical protein